VYSFTGIGCTVSAEWGVQFHPEFTQMKKSQLTITIKRISYYDKFPERSWIRSEWEKLIFNLLPSIKIFKAGISLDCHTVFLPQQEPQAG
jgi:hypothetical protein